MNIYNDSERKILLNLAKQAIQYGVSTGKNLPINIDDYSEKLQEHRATFVTLQKNNQLRGCIGSLEAYQPLVLDVVRNAFSAAFNDYRFQQVEKNEIDKLAIHISVLSKPEKMTFKNEEDLLKQIRPNIDGLILSDKCNRGTFLPMVWESLQTPELFLAHLKTKAGFSPDYWSDTLTIHRYTVELI